MIIPVKQLFEIRTLPHPLSNHIHLKNISNYSCVNKHKPKLRFTEVEQTFMYKSQFPENVLNMRDVMNLQGYRFSDIQYDFVTILNYRVDPLQNHYKFLMKIGKYNNLQFI